MLHALNHLRWFHSPGSQLGYLYLMSPLVSYYIFPCTATHVSLQPHFSYLYFLTMFFIVKLELYPNRLGFCCMDPQICFLTFQLLSSNIFYLILWALRFLFLYLAWSLKAISLLLSPCRNLVLPTEFTLNTNNKDKNVTQGAQLCQWSYTSICTMRHE